uniref:Caspase family p20 domain-containing protein n=1 Tax=Ciona savignyi TaxID=51511 RepID=H2YCV8_CIOSA
VEMTEDSSERYGDTVDAAAVDASYLPVIEHTDQQEVKPIDINDMLNFKYKMDHGKRGLFVIFNQKEFNNRSTTLPIRHGTDIDAASLKKTAELLGFEVEIHRDLERKQIKDKMWDYANKGHSDHDCFACAILTHGGRDDVLYAADDKMELNDFTEPFQADKCKSLAGKPKLFFVQACIADQLNKNNPVGKGPSDTVDALNQSAQIRTVPVQADFLISLATTAEHHAWSNESYGSIFIQTLCCVLNKYGHTLDLQKLLTRVNGMVAYNFESWPKSENLSYKKKIPTFTSRLTSDLYFPRPEL